MSANKKRERIPIGRDLGVLLGLSIVLTLLLVYSVGKEYGAAWRGMQKEYAVLTGQPGGVLEGGCRIEQNIISINNRVMLDRCQTCHQGIFNPDAVDFEQPFATHPPMLDEAGEPIEGHDRKKLGCVACHAGNGRGLSIEDAHGRLEHWLHPLRTGKRIQASCFQCHDTNRTDLAGAPDLAIGRRLFQVQACWACHTIEGVSEGKVGPLLTAVGDRLSPKVIERSIVDPKNQGLQPDSAMPRFDLPDEQIDGLTIFLTSQRRRRLVDQRLPGAISRFRPASGDSAGVVEQGKALFEVRGCTGCHMVRTGQKTVSGRLVCPELTYTGRRLGEPYIKRHLLKPKEDVADSIMPPFDFLPTEERDALAAFLMAQSFEPEANEGVDPAVRAAGHYQFLCASCHGDTGNGLGPVADVLDPKPKNFQKRAFVAAYGDRFVRRILEGVPGTAMPAWKPIVSEEEAQALAEQIRVDFAQLVDGSEYVRRARPAPGPVPDFEAFDAYLRGSEVFAVFCAGCHGRLGTGKGANAYDLLAAGTMGIGGDPQGEALPRNLRNPRYFGAGGVLDRQRTYDSIRLGVPGTAMPPWDRGLSEQAIHDVLEFVLQMNNREFQRRAKEEK